MVGGFWNLVLFYVIFDVYLILPQFYGIFVLGDYGLGDCGTLSIKSLSPSEGQHQHHGCPPNLKLPRFNQEYIVHGVRNSISKFSV